MQDYSFMIPIFYDGFFREEEKGEKSISYQEQLAPPFDVSGSFD